jgi:transmembrane sensor
MATVHDRISFLVLQHLKKELTIPEQSELDAWINTSEENRQLFADLTNEETLHQSIQEIHDYKQIAWSLVSQETHPVRTIAMYRRTWFKWTAAASIIGLLIIGWWLVSREVNKELPVAVAPEAKDVAPPASTRAMITLANGTKIYLDSAGTGTLATQDGVDLVRTSHGEVLYKGDPNQQPSANSHQLSYNTLTNPRGSRVISLTLADGTRVWLNNESSIRYPTAFTGSERKVEITGEAYFEVAHDASRPFHVTKNELQVQVLGTQFNVSAYDEEQNIKVTLVEGSVRVITNSQALREGRTASSAQPGKQFPVLTLKPGQQAVAKSIDGTHYSSLITHTTPNLDEVLAWKNNRFYFDGADIHTVMRQLARWYDVEIVYQDHITQHFTGIISRTVNASEVFAMLQQTGAVKFEIAGKRVVVKKMSNEQ